MDILLNIESNALQIFVFRRTAYHHFKFAGLHDIFHIAVKEGQFIRRNRECNALGLSRSEGDATKILQLLYRTSCRAIHIADIELCHLYAFTGTRIFHRKRHIDRLRRLNPGRRQLRLGILERCVRQTISEWVERSVGTVFVFVEPSYISTVGWKAELNCHKPHCLYLASWQKILFFPQFFHIIESFFRLPLLDCGLFQLLGPTPYGFFVAFNLVSNGIAEVSILLVPKYRF